MAISGQITICISISGKPFDSHLLVHPHEIFLPDSNRGVLYRIALPVRKSDSSCEESGAVSP